MRAGVRAGGSRVAGLAGPAKVGPVWDGQDPPRRRPGPAGAGRIGAGAGVEATQARAGREPEIRDPGGPSGQFVWSIRVVNAIGWPDVR